MSEGRPGFRTEHAALGGGLHPADALWGAQTQRAVVNFPISGERLPPELIAALGSIKDAAALVNAELGMLDVEMAEAIHHAAADVARGRHDDQFPVDVFQTGSGTSANTHPDQVTPALRARVLRPPVQPPVA